MRIWSLHPKYLDAKGLVALWRETLLAKNVLLYHKQGYRNHPQLNRFKSAVNPMDAINQYLAVVFEESQHRGYRFDKGKIDWQFSFSKILVSNGQLLYERDHLLKKLQTRDQEKYIKLLHETEIEVHPLFQVVDGEIEEWEIF